MPTEKEFLAKKALLNTKQDKLTAGTNIQIDPVTNRISAINDAEIIDVQVNGQSVLGVDKIARVNVDTVEPNPTSTPTDTLTSVDINGTIYELQGGGGNADYIELTQAEYNALTPAEKNNGKMYFITDGESEPINIVTNVIVNGVSVVTNKIASFSVPEIEANPTGTATDTLNTVDIDGTIYEIQGGSGSDVSITPTLATGTKIADFEIDGVQGELYAPNGGGSSVTPNPTDTPTDTLNTIGIDGTVFDIAGSGGSSSGVYIEEVLWEGTASTSAWASPIELAIDIEPYDFIVANIYNSMHVLSSKQIPTGSITGDISIGVGGYLGSNGDNRSAWFNKDTNLLRIFTSTGTPIEVTKIVGIKVSGNYFTPQIYSTEEREVGVWIDGKPLYQKTLSKTLTSTNDYIDLVDIDDIDTFVNANGAIRYAESNFNQDVVIPCYLTTSYYLRIYYVSNAKNDLGNNYPDNQILFLETTNDFIRYYKNLFVTIYYTKVDDVAGSGKYNSFGVPTHHYSTEEQVIGTWIDGSTVYEKIFDLGSDVSYGAGWHVLDIPKGNINRIFDGLFISDSGVSCNIGLACNDATYLEILVYSGTSQVLGRYIKARYTKTT